jgi:hypothetical protein
MTSAAAESILDVMLQAMRDGGDGTVCHALDMLAEKTGQNKFRHAAGVVRGTKLGRRAVDDRRALWRIERGETVADVAAKVARPGEKPTSVERRLRRKLGANKTSDELVLSEKSIL